ncbi:lactadherin-like isoform X2 [Patiria miniata]|uniref:F5/8 type C domain-containing protein n=1 Tax=Patiria miniata TaxID=46514 RepID=A0A914AZS2_PATMI|nr:lactadherin-like isoform X2 [Patiria miniata]
MEGLTGGIYLFWISFACVSLVLLAKENKEAMPCTITQEPDPHTGRYRWLIPAVDPCECTQIGMGGFSTFVPYRPYEVTYYDTFLISSDPGEIQQWLNCPGDSPCSVEGTLGMEDGRIPDQSITASSFFRNLTAFGPVRARLNLKGNAEAWCNDDVTDNISPWIQVAFNGTVTITGLITQGRGDYDQWVTEYRVTNSRNGGQSWNNVTDVDGKPIGFPGNNDGNTVVTTRFPFALRTRILRIRPTAWYVHCSMRFEVIGCY